MAAAYSSALILRPSSGSPTARCAGKYWLMMLTCTCGASSAPGDGIIIVLGIGQIDVDDAIQQAQGCCRLVAAAVVHQRQSKASRDRVRQRSQDLRHKVRRGHQVQIVAALVLELQHHQCQALVIHVLSDVQLADGIVLAKQAPARAAGKKDRARAPAARDGRFLPGVAIPACHARVGAAAAVASFAGQTIDAAVSRAQGATGQQPASRLGAPLQLADLIEVQV